ncbi:MAG: hypothetical protein M3O91_10020, partial [Chloroflexota bacterium]|nr:hypothetical protein [Chloroflexota bacterium]
MGPRVARACSALAAVLAVAYGLFFVFGPTGTTCSIGVVNPGGPAATTDAASCHSTNLLQSQPGHLFPAPLLYIALWSFAPVLAFFGVRLASRQVAIASVAFAFIAELSGIMSMGGGFVYAIVVGPLLVLALVSL